MAKGTTPESAPQYTGAAYTSFERRTRTQTHQGATHCTQPTSLQTTNLPLVVGRNEQYQKVRAKTCPTSSPAPATSKSTATARPATSTTSEDQDVFKVQLEARTAYQIEVWGDDATDNGGNLADPEVRLRNWLFDNLTNATFVEQTNTSTAKQSAYGGISDADGGLGQNSLIPIAVYQTARTTSK